MEEEVQTLSLLGFVSLNNSFILQECFPFADTIQLLNVDPFYSL